MTTPPKRSHYAYTGRKMKTQKKIAIVTGAGSGIGRSATLALLEEGFAVVLAGRTRQTLEETVQAAEKKSAKTLIVPTDVTDPKSVHQLFSETQKAFGRLDLLFNNAGINVPGVLLEDLSPTQWKSVIDTNLNGAFYCTQEAFKLMKKQKPMGGRIINNGSISAHVPRPNSAPYTAAKHAITGLTKSTALDGRKYNIACGQIDIGNATTEMAQRMSKGVPQANGSTAVEPMMDVKHVAEAILYMAKLPLDANVLSLTVMATKMPFVGRG